MHQRFIEVCGLGDLDQAKTIVQEILESIDIVLSKAFQESCAKGKLKVAQWLVEHGKSIGSPVDIHEKSEKAFRDSFLNDHLEVAQWLVEYGKSIDSPVDIHVKSDILFRWTCWSRKIEKAQWMVDYAESVGSPIDIHAESDQVFWHACASGRLQFAQWVFRYGNSIGSPVDIHANSEHAFVYSCMHGYFEVAKWLLPFGGMPVCSLSKDHPIRRFHMRRFPSTALLSLYFRRYVRDFRKRYYRPGGKGFEAARDDFLFHLNTDYY